MELSAFISKQRKSLPPGFRFHPTDVELVLYYLKRKVMGKRLRSDVIADINIYQFSPWDLPDMSSLKSKDLEWFFFCPKEKKYARGVRVKRATEKGYWKTTGKCRNIYSGEKIVGSVTTLVFHLGHAPQGERTDWVNHEYKIIDAQLAAVGLEDTYVLCKVFKKNGPGPKVGAQYGAPFDEEEWADDDIELSETHAASSTPNVQSSQTPEIKSDALFIGQCSNLKQTSPSTGMPHPGSTSGPSLVESLQPLLQDSVSVLDQEFDDDIDRFLASFTDDPSLLKNGHQKDALVQMTQKMSAPCLDGYDVYGGLQNFGNIFAPMDQPRFDLARMPKGNDTFPNMHMQDSSDYIELNDLDMPLPNPFTETFGNGQPYDVAGSYSHNYVPQLSFTGINHPTSCIDQSPMISAQSNNGNSGMDINQVNHFPFGSNAVYDPFTYKQSSNGESASSLINEDMFGSSSR